MIQLQALNYLLDTKDSSMLLINNIDDTFFSDYKDEFNFIKSHLLTYGNIPDKATFLSKFTDFDIVVVSENSDYILDELYNDRNKRELAKVFNKVRKYLNEDRLDDATSEYLKATESIVKAKHIDSIDILRNTDRYKDFLEKNQDFSKYYLTTGFKELDDLIGGWDRREELATIVARPGVGKSWILLKSAIAAAEKGLNVGLYSGEMSEEKVGYRADTLISHISNGAILHGNDSVINEYKRYIDSLPNKFGGSLKVLTPAMIQGPAGVNALRAFIEKESLDVLYIDQHSLLEDDRKARNPAEKASNISRDLKNLQVMKKIPIIAVSQQNRESTDNGVSTSHVAASDRISQDSTVIIFLEQKENKLILTLVKSRDSSNNKKLTYVVDFNKGLFEFVPSEESSSTSIESLIVENAEDEYDVF